MPRLPSSWSIVEQMPLLTIIEFAKFIPPNELIFEVEYVIFIRDDVFHLNK
jgi:hypothetical protein